MIVRSLIMTDQFEYFVVLFSIFFWDTYLNHVISLIPNDESNITVTSVEGRMHGANTGGHQYL